MIYLITFEAETFPYNLKPNIYKAYVDSRDLSEKSRPTQLGFQLCILILKDGREQFENEYLRRFLKL